MDPTTRAAANVPLALHYARHHYRGDLSYDEAVSACYEGLVEAARRYDPGRNVRFSTYATYWMHQSLRQARIQATTIRVPHYLWDPKARRRPENAAAAARAHCVASGWHGEDFTPFDSLEARPSGPGDRGESGAAEALAVLDGRERDVIVRRFGIGCRRQTLKEIGDDLGFTREWVRQIEKRALEKMRAHAA